eukprot:CAMPEP_0194337106 /NCGR_PEP_ID=MMETSP0171-20130528/75221_1 /TAXON_ID=218684 /ORGANISM="Corethron pennatum, Strain L29A3" /LENGTH=71 /DNA_ID=CAMNT_0039100765 /DNA_START=126 /DNA_END=338 /DNA_ORIENTATION=-
MISPHRRPAALDRQCSNSESPGIGGHAEPPSAKSPRPASVTAKSPSPMFRDHSPPSASRGCGNNTEETMEP